jgi:hypothetical protein
VRVFREEFTLEDAIGSHACSLEANMRVTNAIPLKSSLLLPVHTVNCVQTRKAGALEGDGIKYDYCAPLQGELAKAPTTAPPDNTTPPADSPNPTSNDNGDVIGYEYEDDEVNGEAPIVTATATPCKERPTTLPPATVATDAPLVTSPTPEAGPAPVDDDAPWKLTDLVDATALGDASKCYYAIFDGAVRVFRQKSTREDAIGSHACSIEALACV